MTTQILPPALPIFLTVGQTFGLYRLQQKDVFAIDSEKLLQAGFVRTACFDKTGTLTKASHEMLGYCDTTCDSSATPFFTAYSATLADSKHASLYRAFGTCHSVTIVDGK